MELGGLPSIFRDAFPEKGWALGRSQRGADGQSTDVLTRVELQSRLGQVRERIAKARASSRQAAAFATSNREDGDEDATAPVPAKVGLLRSWGMSSVQRSIETIGLRRTERSQPNSKEGMNVVLERLRKGGITAVLDGMRSDREMIMKE